jgi:hypothetical protein
VQQDGDMRGRQSEHPGDVLAGDLVQHAQGYDRTLDVSKGIESTEHERKILCPGYQLFDGLSVRGDEGQRLIARIMRARDRVLSAPVPRVVPYHGREQLHRIIVRYPTSRRACGSKRKV